MFSEAFALTQKLGPRFLKKKNKYLNVFLTNIECCKILGGLYYENVKDYCKN